MEVHWAQTGKDQTSTNNLLRNDSGLLLEDLKNKISEINQHINYSKDRIRGISTSKSASGSAFLSPKPQILPISSPRSEYFFENDEAARPIYETSLQIINQKENELRKARELAESATRDIENIKKEEKEDLERQILYETKEAEKRKIKLRDEYEAILKAVDAKLKDDIARKRLESEKKIERRLQTYHTDLSMQAYSMPAKSTLSTTNALERLSFASPERFQSAYQRSPIKEPKYEYADRRYSSQKVGASTYRNSSRRDIGDISANIENRLNNLKVTLDEVRGRRDEGLRLSETNKDIRQSYKTNRGEQNNYSSAKLQTPNH